MANRRTLIATSLLTLMIPAAAQATGNADCSIDEPGLKATFEAIYSYGGTGEMLKSIATIDLTDPKRPPGKWTFDLDGSALEQHWLVDDEFRALIHREREGTEMVLEIQARRTAPDDVEFSGTYRLVIGPSDGSLYSRTSKVACSKG